VRWQVVPYEQRHRSKKPDPRLLLLQVFLAVSVVGWLMTRIYMEELRNVKLPRPLAPLGEAVRAPRPETNIVPRMPELKLPARSSQVAVLPAPKKEEVVSQPVTMDVLKEAYQRSRVSGQVPVRVPVRAAEVPEDTVKPSGFQRAVRGVEKASWQALGVEFPVIGLVEVSSFGFIEVAMERLAQMIAGAGEKGLTRRLTEADLERFVIRRFRKKFPQVRNAQTRFTSGGYAISADIHTGLIQIPILLKGRISIAQRRPHIHTTYLAVGEVLAPGLLIRLLDNRINQKIDEARFPLHVDAFNFQEGAVDVKVTLAE